MTHARKRELHSIGTVLRGTSGYFLAGGTCTFAGYALKHGTVIPRGAHVAFLGIFLLLLLACLTNHAALYEQRDVRRRHIPYLQAFSIQIPALLIAGAVVGAYLYYASYRDDYLYDPRWILALLSASIPFGVISAHRTIHLKNSDLYTFRARSYFPALATSLPAFIIGYYLEAAVILLIVSGLLILILWFASLRLSVEATYGIQAFLLLTAIIVFTFWPVEQVGVWTLGMFLTLAMGVSEAWRVTSRVLAGIEYRPSGLYTQYEQRGFLSGANIATALFLPLFLLTYLHPQTEQSYLPFVLIWLLAGSLSWFRYGSSTNYRRVTFWAFVFETSLPVTLGIAAQMQGEIALPTPPPLEHWGGLYTIIVGSLATLGISIAIHKKMPRNKDALIEHYLQPNNAITLTGGVSALLALFGCLISLILGGQSSQYNKFESLMSIYICFSIAALFWGKFVASPGPEEGAANVA